MASISWPLGSGSCSRRRSIWSICPRSARTFILWSTSTTAARLRTQLRPALGLARQLQNMPALRKEKSCDGRG